MKSISHNIVRQLFLLSLIIILGVVIFWQLQSFVPALLGAYTLYVLLKKWMYMLTHNWKWKRTRAAALLMLSSFIVILFPVVILINMLTSKINFAIQHGTQVLNSISQYITMLEQEYHFDLVSDESIAQLKTWGAGALPQLLGATFNSVITIVFMHFILYFMLMGGYRVQVGLFGSFPLRKENSRMLGKEMDALVFSNAVGIPLIAIFQGVLGLIAYLVLGVKEPFFWFFVTCIASMMPVVGATLAYVPVGILFFASGMTAKGIIMLVYGFGVISTLDSVFRFWLEKKIGNVHPLITAFGVILGIDLFGFIGLVFGPILISLFLLLVKIYVKEFGIEETEPQEP